MSLRVVLRLLLSLALILPARPAVARSDLTNPLTDTRPWALQIAKKIIWEGQPRAFQNLRTLGLSADKIGARLKSVSESRPAEMAAHVGQTMLFLLAAAGIDLIKTRFEAQHQSHPSGESLAKAASDAATQIVDNGAVYLSILGAAGVGLASYYPVSALTALLANADSRPIMHERIRISIMMIVANFGWEWGSQLWTEATFMLDTPEEYARVRSLFGMASGAFRHLFGSRDHTDARDLKLVGKMARNLLYVALIDQEASSRWIDITVRTRIMTGEFAVITAALAAAGIGTMLLPGGGTVVGFILGLGAYLVATSLPHELYDSITGGLHWPRLNFQRGRLRTRELELRQWVRSKPLFNQSESTRLQRARALLESRRGYRSNYLTVVIEQVRMVLKELRQRSCSTTQARQNLRSLFKGLHDFFSSESAIFNGFQSRSSIFLQLFVEEENKVLELATFFNEVGLALDGLFDEQPGSEIKFQNLDSQTQEFVKFIEVAYARGFNEKKIYTDK